MNFDKNFVQKVKEANPIVDLVSSSVPLRRSGSNFIGNCPFHADTKKKLTVSPSKGTYRCYVCGESGDAIEWLRNKDNLTFPQAVEHLARRAGIPTPQ